MQYKKCIIKLTTFSNITNIALMIDESCFLCLQALMWLCFCNTCKLYNVANASIKQKCCMSCRHLWLQRLIYNPYVFNCLPQYHDVVYIMSSLTNSKRCNQICAVNILDPRKPLHEVCVLPPKMHYSYVEFKKRHPTPPLSYRGGI